MKLKILFLLLITVVLFFSSCDSTLKPARGEEDEIIVIADSTEYALLEHSLKHAFEKVIITPQPEKLFFLRRVPFGEWENYKYRKNIVIVAPINSGSGVSRFVNTLIDSAVKEKIYNGEASYIIRNNLWAKGQIVFLVTATTVEQIEFSIMNYSDKFLYNLRRASDKRMMDAIYTSKFQNKELEDSLLNKYGFKIFSQVDFVLAIEKPEDNFLWLRRSPDTALERWIFIHWIDNANATYLNKDSIISIRNRMTQKFYVTSDDQFYVEIADSNFTPTEVNFNEKYALYSQGLWRMTDRYMGGPFINYTFLDTKNNRLYMIDGSLYAPKYTKRKILQQIDIVLQSFRLKEELNNSK